ncbi:response regulator [Novosphingobium lindaniclasticum]|uniref:Response regulatory domain-containing protein n=1 Tax=Novosphingobium lindaniclasticum LE124 TaxID=1096930 RepID=T0J787_9SPHN|nr:response regulator [Novosphingobium lindaniclasticum]EQB17794.1 hypothetical protein L284_06335 [Novosphingobium lindaniclasticum LE124]
MTLSHRRILVVEDEYMLAMDLRRDLEDAGAEVIGPEPSVARALSRIPSETKIDAAVLDVNLGDEEAFPVADELTARGIPFVFATGYGDDAVALRFPGVTTCSKPLDVQAMLRVLETLTRDA